MQHAMSLTNLILSQSHFIGALRDLAFLLLLLCLSTFGIIFFFGKIEELIKEFIAALIRSDIFLAPNDIE